MTASQGRRLPSEEAAPEGSESSTRIGVAPPAAPLAEQSLAIATPEGDAAPLSPEDPFLRDGIDHDHPTLDQPIFQFDAPTPPPNAADFESIPETEALVRQRRRRRGVIVAVAAVAFALLAWRWIAIDRSSAGPAAAAPSSNADFNPGLRRASASTGARSIASAPSAAPVAAAAAATARAGAAAPEGRTDPALRAGPAVQEQASPRSEPEGAAAARARAAQPSTSRPGEAPNGSPNTARPRGASSGARAPAAIQLTHSTPSF